MKIIGFQHVNKNMSAKNEDGVENWRLALTDEDAHRKQTAYSRRPRRKIKLVGA